jgi:hypothetical protein
MFSTIAQIKQANRRAGFHFFDRASMRFFSSRVSSLVVAGRYFITSERDTYDRHYNYPRAYTIRVINSNGSVDTVGEFQQYATLSQAKRAVYKLAAEGVEG